MSIHRIQLRRASYDWQGVQREIVCSDSLGKLYEVDDRLNQIILAVSDKYVSGAVRADPSGCGCHYEIAGLEESDTLIDCDLLKWVWNRFGRDPKPLWFWIEVPS